MAESMRRTWAVSSTTITRIGRVIASESTGQATITYER